MKFPAILKKPAMQLFTFSIILFIMPYIAPLVQGGSSEASTFSFYPPRIVFILAASGVILLSAWWIRKKAVRIPVTAALWAVLELLVMFEAFMLCFVGHSFDQSFLLHFNVDAVSGEVIKVFWKPVTFVMLLYFAAIAAAGYLASRINSDKFNKKEIPATLIAIGLLFIPNTPLSVLLGVITENIQASGAPKQSGDLNSIYAKPGKNLVFIVVESLEQNYLSEEHFPDLLPNIKKYLNSSNALVFENMVSVPRNTFDFLYQSHMGNYMYSISDSEYADKQISLSMLLKKAGYNTSFLKACTLDFASTGTFVEKVQYEKRMDWQHPEIKPQATYLGEWGFRDYDLFEMAKNEFRKLADQKKPFAFTLFTVDSHAPNGVIGEKSLTYTMPDGEKHSLLSALHTTDNALGKFLDFIEKSPEGKDTVVVIAGDHLVMKSIVPNGKSVQAMLEYKPRKNLLVFILNGKEKGKISETTWPVDLAPTILHQLEVDHNAVFPCGVNVITEKNAAPRNKLSYAQFMEEQKKKLAEQKGVQTFLESNIHITGEEKQLIMHIGSNPEKCDPLIESTGTIIEYPSQFNKPTDLKGYVERDTVKVFRTNPRDRDLCYTICTHRKTLFHFIFGEYNWDSMLLGAIVGGWYKYYSADKFTSLKLTNLDIPLPRIADAEFDVSKNIVTLKKNGWTLPLFSKNNTYLPQCAIAAADDKQGKETVMRKHFYDDHEMKDLYDMLENKEKMTLIAPPDSEFHKKYNVPVEQRDQILRLHITPEGKKAEMIPMRKNGEDYIRKEANGKYFYCKEGVRDFSIRLGGPAPQLNFAKGLCYALTIDAQTGKVLSSRSFKQSRIAVELMLNRAKGEKTFIICGKGSEFLKKFYPALAQKNVLFYLTPNRIHHSIQYSNGNFRIPDEFEPLDVLNGASAHLADNAFIASWGNSSFIMPKEELETNIAKGHEVIIKLQQHNPADFVSFTVTDPAWLNDIAKAWKTDFMIIGYEKSKFPQVLQQKNQNKFYVSLSRGSGWEFFWSDKLNISVAPAIFKHEK
ncbi:MAG: LTA synthase family protein [Lentisphaeria bacterium]|nr:LTA synthase family protein [Lentisphaeria bacterium]